MPIACIRCDAPLPPDSIGNLCASCLRKAVHTRPAPIRCHRCGRLLREARPGFTPQDRVSLAHPLCRHCRHDILHG